MSDDLPAALAGLVGAWQGEGVASSPDADADFRFGQELTIRIAGAGLLLHTSRTWALPEPDSAPPPDPVADAGERLLLESGFWRWDVATENVELVLATASGGSILFVGRIKTDAGGGTHIDLVSDVAAHTASGAPVTAEKRLYSRRGEVLLYAVDQARSDAPMAPRASAALHPSPPD